MNQLILDSTQTQIVLHSHGEVRVCDPDGKLLGVFAPAANTTADPSPFTLEDIAAAKRALASPGPWRTTKEVLERLHAVEQENG